MDAAYTRTFTVFVLEGVEILTSLVGFLLRAEHQVN